MAEKEKLYIGSKLIIATPMDECTFLNRFKGEDVIKYHEIRLGYKVTYPDGYVSWSPRKTFKIAYREVTNSERRLF